MQLRTPLRAHFSRVLAELNLRNYLDMLSPHSLAQAHHGIWVWPWAPQSEAPFGMSITHAGASSFPRERPHHHIFAPFYLPFFFFFFFFQEKKVNLGPPAPRAMERGSVEWCWPVKHRAEAPSAPGNNIYVCITCSGLERAMMPFNPLVFLSSHLSNTAQIGQD